MASLDYKQRLAIAKDLADQIITDDEVATLEIDAEDVREIRAFARYELAYRAHMAAQQPALGLLRRFLTREQKTQLRKHYGFLVQGSDGGMYRLHPHGSNISRCIQRNGRWLNAIVFCYHDPSGEMPSADEALGTMLKLMTDESAFLKEANLSRIELHPDVIFAALPELVRS